MRILSAISVAAVFFVIVIYVNTFVSLSRSSYSSSKTKQTSHTTQGLMKSTGVIIPLKAARETIIGDDLTPPVPPSHLTKQKRIAWFKSKLPEFDILKSNNRTRLFHSRVVEFLRQECEAKFFMTWISSARSFGRREFLSMESVLKTHPAGCLIIISPSMDSARGYTILEPLVHRGLKVAALTPDLPSLLSNTPAEAWLNDIKRGNNDPGAIPLAQNLSNLIRLAVLYKYGGVYLDTDFIVIKSLIGLRNAIGAQSVDAASMKWSRLNNAVLAFDSGHPLLFKFMEEFGATFDGNKWGHNGPYLVSRVARRVEGRAGYNFTVLPPMALYPVIWTKMDGLFKKARSRAECKWVEEKLEQMRGESYGVHLWNKATKKMAIEEGSIMARLISDHCIICHKTPNYNS